MTDTDKGRAQTEQMFAAIGRAITRWSFVEQRLSVIFTVCNSDVFPRGTGLDLGECSVPIAVFYSVENFRGKLALVDVALNAHVSSLGYDPKDVIDDWPRLKEKTRKLSLKRNKLAHHTVLPGFDTEDQTISPRLVPPYGSPAYWKQTGFHSPQTQLSLFQLQHLETAFCLLEDRLRDFAFRLASHEGLFDKYALRAARRIRSHCRTNPNREAVLKRELSILD